MDDHAKLSRDLVQVDEDGREWYSLRNAPAFLISSQLSDDWIYAAQAVLAFDGMLDGAQLSTADVACRRFECERELIRRLADGDLEARGFNARSFSSDPEFIERLRWLSFTSVDFDAGIASDGITAISGIMVSRSAAQRPQVGPPRTPRISEADVRSWYRFTWIPHAHVSAPSRDDDEREAAAHFGARPPRELLRKLRKEFAPPEWKRRGPKGFGK